MRVLLALITAFLLVSGPALAQEASPAAEEGLPEGVVESVLARGVAERLEPGQLDVGLLRLTVPPRTRVPFFASHDAALILVESGTITIDIAPVSREDGAEGAATPVAARASGVELTLGPGQAAILPALAEGEARNDGADPTVMVALVAGPPTRGVPAPAADATPGVSAEGVRFEALGIGTDEALPNGPVEMLITRTSVAPGVTIPPQPHPGPEVGVIEAGSFTFQTAEGPGVTIIHGLAGMTTAGAAPTLETTGPDLDVTANAGDAYFVPTGSVSGGTAGLDTEVIGLSGSLAPRGVAIVTPDTESG